MSKHLLISALFALSFLVGCASKSSDFASTDSIIGDYTFASDSEYAGGTLEIGEEEGSLFIILEGHRMDLKPKDDHFRFTTGDEVWNKEETEKVMEWFIIAYDPNKKQYYLGSPDDSKWCQYLIKK